MEVLLKISGLLNIEQQKLEAPSRPVPGEGPQFLFAWPGVYLPIMCYN
jgi:hypothetical protein